MRNHKRLIAVVSILAVALIASAFSVVFAAAPVYFDIEDASFAGRTTITFYEHDGTKLGSNDTIHYMAAYIVGLADDDESLVMTGNFSANTTLPNGAVIMLWKSQYGPWGNATAYATQNMSTCTYGPDYFFICWGLQGDYTRSGFWGNSKPYLTLEGVGLCVDWDQEEVVSFGTAQLKSKIYSTGSGNATTMTKIKADTMLQLWQVAGGPHHLAYKSGSNLPVLDDGSTCWACLWRGFPEWLCDWMYAHFGIDLCPQT
jgi:hypothetical protein